MAEIDDRIVLNEMFNRYSEALDRKEWNLLEGFFADDAVGQFSSQDGQMDFEISGGANIVEFARSMIGSPELVTQHLMANFSAAIDGDTATASTKMRAYHHGIGPREGLFEESIGHYVTAGCARQRNDGNVRLLPVLGHSEGSGSHPTGGLLLPPGWSCPFQGGWAGAAIGSLGAPARIRGPALEPKPFGFSFWQPVERIQAGWTIGIPEDKPGRT